MNNKNAKYLREHIASGIHVNDTVTIKRKAKTRERGWDAVWVDRMNNLVGRLFRVSIDLGVSGFVLSPIAHEEEREDGFMFPYFVLEKVSMLHCTLCGAPIPNSSLCDICNVIRDINNLTEEQVAELAERRDKFSWQP